MAFRGPALRRMASCSVSSKSQEVQAGMQQQQQDLELRLQEPMPQAVQWVQQRTAPAPRGKWRPSTSTCTHDAA
eukprot:1141147-Pelagomonas_calceolata.AAC.2